MEPLNRREVLVWAVAAGASQVGPVFGVEAKPDEADATERVEKAVQACVKAGRGMVYLPAGSYTLSKRIDIDLPPGAGFAFRGDGPGMTRITWTGKDAGLHVRFKPEGGFDGEKGTILVEGLNLLTAHPDGGSAIRLTGEGGTSPTPKKLVCEVILAGASPAAGWSVGVDCIDCTFCTLDNIDYQGSGQSAGVAIRFSGDRDPVDNYVSRLRVLGARDGVEITGNCEGIYLSQSTMLAVERGVHWHTTRGEPLLSMTGCHVSASRECVLGHNLIQSLINNNLFYQAPGSGTADTEWAGVRLTADSPSIYDLLQVCHNTIHGFPGPAKSRHGVVIEGRQGGLVQGNIIQGPDAGVLLTASTSDMRVLDNIVREFKVADVVDEGKGNVVRRV